MEKIPNQVTGDKDKKGDESQDVFGSHEASERSLTETTHDLENNLDTQAAKIRTHINEIMKSGVVGNFLKDSSLSFTVGDRGSGFYFSSEGKINLDPEWFLERGFEEEAVEWAIYHEARHANDRRESPEVFDSRLDFCIEKAESYLPTILAKWESVLDLDQEDQSKFFTSLTEKVPVDDGTGSQREVARAVSSLSSTYFSVLFNSLDDVWVNHGIYNEVPKFEPGKQGGELIKDLYRKVLFKNTDYRGMLRSYQYAYALLRKSMLPEEEVLLDSEVVEFIDQNFKYFGKEYEDRHDLVCKRLFPGLNVATDMESRYKLIEQTFLPDFDALINLDLDDWQPQWQSAEKSQGGQAEKEDSEAGEGSDENTQSNAPPSPFDAPLEEHDRNTIDQLDDKAEAEISNFLDKEKANQAEKDRIKNLPPEEQRKFYSDQARHKRYGQVADQEGLEGKERESFVNQLEKNSRQYLEYKKMVEPYIEELAEVWREIIGRGVEYRSRRMRFQEKGEVDIKQVIAHYPDISRGYVNQENPLRVYERNITEARDSIIPEEIQVFFACDLSGSMDQRDKEMLKQVSILIAESFRELQNMIYQNHATNTPDENLCKVRTKIIGYSDEAFVIKDNTEDTTYEDLEAVPSKIDTADQGYTHSEKAFSNMLDEVRTYEDEKVTDGRIKTLVIEITDGGCDLPEVSKSQVDELKEKHQAIVFGLLVEPESRVESDGYKTLRFVHGENSRTVTLETVTEEIKQLIKTNFEDGMV